MLSVPHTVHSPGIAQQRPAAAGNTMYRRSPAPRPAADTAQRQGPGCYPRPEDQFQSEPTARSPGKGHPPSRHQGFLHRMGINGATGSAQLEACGAQTPSPQGLPGSHGLHQDEAEGGAGWEGRTCRGDFCWIPT